MILIGLIMFLSCNNKHTRPKNIKIDGKWQLLTITKNKDSIIYIPSDANNKSIELSSNSIKIDYGQEIIEYKILGTVSKLVIKYYFFVIY